MVWTTYKEKIHRLSCRIVDAQRPIRILDAIKWDDSVEALFFQSKCKELPLIDAAYYARVPLGFDPERKMEEFSEIIRDIRSTLGEKDDIGGLLLQMAEQYIDVVAMLANRGTKKFYEISRKLYGSPKDRFFKDTNSVVSLGRLLYSILSQLHDEMIGHTVNRDLKAEDVVKILNERFNESFLKGCVDVRLSDGIVADAAAGSNYISINRTSQFSAKDVDILEVHEGWVHLATTANGSRQQVATWLSKGPPRCTATQEGLAVLLEVITLRSFPSRARKLNNRILAIDKAEDGANALDIFNFYRSEGYDAQEAYRSTMRTFRGGVASGGAPFTKDISYCRGFIENYNFIRTAIRKGRPELVRFLFAGKMHVSDTPLLYQKYQEGLVDPPTYLPSFFADLSGLAVWMGFSNFLNLVDLKAVQDDYEALFSKFL